MITLTGGKGSDRFVLAVDKGIDNITDFQDSQDLLGLSGNSLFGQLTITQGTGVNASNTLIRATGNDELLAVLN